VFKSCGISIKLCGFPKSSDSQLNQRNTLKLSLFTIS